ncbi:hypothetical protein OEZ85_001699 [Tetradesmus obliquus]|uniref:ApaG domain-containing protein n=1 Tax=Tetradesmus obliquus TaxID=3088 RepID=A0ABY8U0M6_TETOB|nr:hypothetical protein OEZ85_001699 [Tetradesmus obliquus]
MQVTWSSVLVPQESRQGRLMFTYSVKFTLLSPDREAEALQRLEQQQQRWQQQQQQQQQGSAAQEGTADGEEFSYASCTPFAVSSGREGAAGLASSRSGPEAAAAAGLGAADDASQLVGRVLGAMEGSFSFVQGSMMQRMGPEFGVRCPRLVFAVPEYLY